MNLHDLDLSTVPSDDIDKLASKIESYYQMDSSQKAYLSYSWELNHLMLDGQQWLVYDGSIETGGIWRRLTPNPANEYIPRPVTNYLFHAYQTLKGYLLKNKPRATVRSNTQTYRDKIAAKIAELILECNYERLRESYNYEYAASCLITYGTVFKKDYWDSAFSNSVKIPKMEEQPIMDPATGLPTGQTKSVPAIDPLTGEPLFDTIPLGDVNTAIVEPYRIAMDPMASNLHEARWIMEYSIRPISWIKENYNKQEPGYTGKAADVKEEKTLPNSLRRFFQLKTSSGVRGTQSGFTGIGQTGSQEMIENAAVVKEYYERPCENYPAGRLIVVANNMVLYVAESPYTGPEQGDWHPYSECRWEVVPGRFWGKSPMDNAVEIQRQINSIDSTVILTRKTMAVPQKLVPQGSIVKGQWTGMPGQQVEFRTSPGGEKPEIFPATGVDNSVFTERQQRIDDLKMVMGAMDILAGDRPPGVTAASALNLLFEVGTGKLFPILDRWKMFIEQSQKKQLRMIAVKYKEPREQFIQMLISRNKELTEDQLKNFIGRDLWDNCNVIIEAGSNVPKLKAGEQASLLEIAQLGVLNLEDPANKKEFLSRFGIQGFDSGYGKDAQRAAWENSIIDNMIIDPEKKPVMLISDNHDIHIAVHEDRTKEPSFMDLDPAIQQEYFAHIEEHRNAKAEAEQQQMMQSMMMNMPPPPPEGNPMDKEENIRKGKGVSPKTKETLQADMLGPFAGVGKQ